MKNILICIDRDDTLIYDDHYHLGHTEDWKAKVKFMPGVLEGVKSLRKSLPSAKIYMITNQPGVAVTNFKKLSLERAHEVCVHIMDLLNNKGAILDGYFLCPFASPQYVKMHPHFSFDKAMVRDDDCFKPRPGMIHCALNEEGWKMTDTSIYVIGNRATDVQAALNVKGFGVLVPAKNEPGEDVKFKKIKNKDKTMMKDFLQAIELIVGRES